MKLLSEFISDPNQRKQMIHVTHVYTPFCGAAKNGHINIMKFLLELISDPKQYNEMIHYGKHEAFRQAAINGHIEVLKFLIEHTSDQNQRNEMIYDTIMEVVIFHSMEQQKMAIQA